MRAVLDPNVLISAAISSAISSTGAPAQVVRRWLDGEFEVVTSEMLFEELARALAYPKLRKRVRAADAAEYVALVRRESVVRPDPVNAPSVVSPDADDNYLIALAESTRSVLVSGDGHLLGLAEQLPVYSPASFLELIP